MPQSVKGYKHIMVVCCEITRYLITIPLKDLKAETICEALLQRVITVHGIFSRLITDADS